MEEAYEAGNRAVQQAFRCRRSFTTIVAATPNWRGCSIALNLATSNETLIDFAKDNYDHSPSNVNFNELTIHLSK
jgi:hypothetical protein